MIYARVYASVGDNLHWSARKKYPACRRIPPADICVAFLFTHHQAACEQIAAAEEGVASPFYVAHRTAVSGKQRIVSAPLRTSQRGRYATYASPPANLRSAIIKYDVAFLTGMPSYAIQVLGLANHGRSCGGTGGRQLPAESHRLPFSACT